MTVAPTEVRILDAAERCMHRYGPRRVSMNDVATEAGVSRGSVYRYFPEREALVDAVLERLATRFVADSEPSVDAHETLEGQVGEAAVFILRHRGDPRYDARLPGDTDSLFAILLTARLSSLLDAWIEFWLPRLASAEERGEIRPGLEHRHLAEWILRLMVSFAVMPAVTVDLADDDAVRAFVADHLVRGLAPGPAAPGPAAP
jgi:AcrR family transcriptional regulator